MSATFKSHNPVTGHVVWEGTASTDEEINDAMLHARDAGNLWRGSSVEQRMEVIYEFGRYLAANRDEIRDLITSEVGKLSWDASAEVNAAIAKVDLSIKAWQQRRSDTLLDSGQPSRRIRYLPLGVTLVLGPFNFPLHLPGGQIIPALLAGNSVVFKPSDQAMAVGQWTVNAWRQAGLPEGVMQLIKGGVATAVAAIDSPLVSAVFLTGSRAAGRAIHHQLAGRPDVLLALELGGNNPIVITEQVQPQIAAALASFSAFISAGQRCTCARRALFINGDSTETQIEALLGMTSNLRVGLPGDEPLPEVGPLISAKAAHGLLATYRELIDLGCEALIPISVDETTQSLVRPAVVDATKLDAGSLSRLGEMEWFGPLLVVQRVSDFDAAIRHAGNTPYGLAASLLGGDRAMFEQYASNVGAGVVNWNGPTTGAAGTLPFGGLGDSGNHRPAGYFAIDFCSDPIATLESERPPEQNPWSIAQ